MDGSPLRIHPPACQQIVQVTTTYIYCYDRTIYYRTIYYRNIYYRNIFWIMLSKKCFTQILALWQMVRRPLPCSVLSECYLLEKTAVLWLIMWDCLQCNARQESIAYNHTAKLSAIVVLSPKVGLHLAVIIDHGRSDRVRWLALMLVPEVESQRQLLNFK